MPMYDAVLIPGGGVREDGILPPWVMPRFDRALELAADACFIPLSAGTTHRPRPLDARGFPITEARAGAAYLMGRGVDPANILMEEASLDTIGNAWFSRTIHVIPRGFERLLVVTSAFHMPRTEAVFRWVYELDAPGPRCTLAFEQTPDAGIDSDDLRARLAKEAASIRALEALRTRITTFRHSTNGSSRNTAHMRPSGSNSIPLCQRRPRATDRARTPGRRSETDPATHRQFSTGT